MATAASRSTSSFRRWSRNATKCKSHGGIRSPRNPEIDPTIAAVSALLIAVAVVVVGTSSLLQRRDGDGA